MSFDWQGTQQTAITEQGSFKKKKKKSTKKINYREFEKKEKKKKKDLYDIQSKHKFSSKLPLCIY